MTAKNIQLSDNEYRVMPKEEGQNVTYYYENDYLVSDKLIKKSNYRYDADAIRTWGMMRKHLREIRSFYANLPMGERSKIVRMRLYHYEQRIQEYILKLEKIITIRFIESPRVEINKEYRDGSGY